VQIRWTSYLIFRAELRGFDLAILEGIVRSSSERYTDSTTGRRIAIGKHCETLVAIPYEMEDEVMVPVTRVGVPDVLVDHATPDESKQALGLTGPQIADRILKLMKSQVQPSETLIEQA